MKRFFLIILRVVWRLYVALCVLLISAYILLTVFMIASNRFDIVQLPNGAYLSHRHFFSWDREDIVMRHPDGRILVNESIEWVCFNDRFVEGNTYYGPKPSFSRYTMRSFIYEKGADEAFFNVDPRYQEVLDCSDLIRWDGCGIRGALTGFYTLVEEQEYGR
jgi:hypothetical protein